MMKENLTKLAKKQVLKALLQSVSFSHHDSLCLVQHSTDALCIMITVCCAADGNLLPAKPLTVIKVVVRCAAASIEGVASQAGDPPPETAEALEAGKHHSRTHPICVLHSA